MNGSLHSPPNSKIIKLKRGAAGLGFNIIGGVDQQNIVPDSGIYVSKIKDDGAAAQDGRLEEGDKILSINGISLENLKHKEVVDLFRTAGEDVELCIRKKPSHRNGPEDSEPERPLPVPLLGILAVFAGAIAIISILRWRK